MRYITPLHSAAGALLGGEGGGANPPAEEASAEQAFVSNSESGDSAELAAESAPLSVTGENGEFHPDWLEQESLADYRKTLSKFKTPEDLARSYANLERMRRVPELGEEADQKAVETFRRANDIPLEAGGYELQLPEDLPAGVEMPEGALEHYQQLAHGINATPAQAQAILDKHLEYLSSQTQEAEGSLTKARQQAVGELRREWGHEFDTKLQNAQKVYDVFSSIAGVNLERADFTENVEFVKLMAAVSSKLSEGSFHQASQGIPGSQFTGGKQEAQNIMSSPTHPDHAAFWDSSHPQHQSIQRKVAQLQQG
ncbi:hypothetical protein Rhal01_03757 [Rubritalea halochordaticola]|uniref:Peptidase n=1 Tax=Rubritalea halochordaticola TaxID=714537 RepID=A0ABP9V4H3_9BACT